MRRRVSISGLTSSMLIAAVLLIAGAAPAQEGPRLVIVRATWGIGEKQADVTEIVRKHVKDGRLDLMVNGISLGDPAFGRLKELVITFDVGGHHVTHTFTPADNKKLIVELADSGARRRGGGTPLEVTVASAEPRSDRPHAEPKPPANPDAIERPEYLSTPRRLMKGLTSVTAMVLRVSEDGEASGFTSDIIATVPGHTRSGKTAGVRLARAEGDEMMKTTLEEAVRAVTLRYPLWEPGHIELSFGEKFQGHAGPSAGTAFALLMLSTLEGFDIDTRCAITGDITVDWRIRRVGGVTAKLRGAILDRCLYAIIPDGNEAAFADMPLLYGNSAVWDIQVFSCATLQDAVAVARTDRSEKRAEALKLFASLQTQLARAEHATLRKPETRKTLQRVLELAPNHLSARHVLAMCEGTNPKMLSANGTIYQLSVLFHPYVRLLSDGKRIDRNTLPAYVTAVARRRLSALRSIAHDDLRPLVADVAGFIEALDTFAKRGGSDAAVTSRFEKLQQSFAALDSDPTFFERLVREGY